VERTEELVKVEKKGRFDDALFELRPGLEKSDMMEQMKGMQQMPSGMPNNN
jgi:hypothetical protein